MLLYKLIAFYSNIISILKALVKINIYLVDNEQRLKCVVFSWAQLLQVITDTSVVVVT